jgi:hypothetical protein
METHGEWRWTSTILELGTRSRWAVTFTPLPLYPWERAPFPPIPIVQEARWGPEPVWSTEESLAPARNQTLAVQPIACHWAIPAHKKFKIKTWFFYDTVMHLDTERSVWGISEITYNHSCAIAQGTRQWFLGSILSDFICNLVDRVAFLSKCRQFFPP